MSKLKILCLIFWATSLAWPALARETVVISGAGPSTVVVTELFKLLGQEPGCEKYDFVVPPRSIKNAGGLSASDTNLFGRTGRPLTPAEKGTSRQEIFLARIPLTFVIDPGLGISVLTQTELKEILRGDITNWKVLGGPNVAIKLVGREKSEAVLMALSETIPEITEAHFQVRLTRDHQLVQMLGTKDRQGVLSFGAASNFDPEMRLQIEGLEIGLAMGLVYNMANHDHPLIQKIQTFRFTDVWQNRVIELGCVPITENHSADQTGSNHR